MVIDRIDAFGGTVSFTVEEGDTVLAAQLPSRLDRAEGRMGPESGISDMLEPAGGKRP